MMVAIMQPTYNAWAGYFDMMDKADVFVYYDDVQLTKRSWQVRNRILTPNGELFLTIPVKKTAHRDDTLIKDAEINYEENWVDKHLGSMEMSYKKSAHFTEVFSFLEGIYRSRILTLGEFNIRLLENIRTEIGITTRTVVASTLKNITGKKDMRLVATCKMLGADSYLSAQGSAAYIEEVSPGGEFARQNISLYYHNYLHPEYQQAGTGTFVPYMGIFDLLFNMGFEKSLGVIRSGRKNDYDFQFYRENILNRS